MNQGTRYWKEELRKLIGTTNQQVMQKIKSNNLTIREINNLIQNNAHVTSKRAASKLKCWTTKTRRSKRTRAIRNKLVSIKLSQTYLMRTQIWMWVRHLSWSWSCQTIGSILIRRIHCMCLRATTQLRWTIIPVRSTIFNPVFRSRTSLIIRWTD